MDNVSDVPQATRWHKKIARHAEGCFWASEADMPDMSELGGALLHYDTGFYMFLHVLLSILVDRFFHLVSFRPVSLILPGIGCAGPCK